MQEEKQRKTDDKTSALRLSNRFSPLRFLFVTVLSFFTAEVVAMAVVYFLPLPFYLLTIIDAGIMVVLIFPVLYQFSFRPLIQHIEELKRSEQKVELERVRLRSILDTMAEGIYIVNQQFDVEYVNPVIEREFGPVTGTKCYAYIHDRNEICRWCKNPTVFEGKTARWEWTSPKNGRTYDVLDTPLRNSDHSLSKLKVMHDITERKRNEEAVLLLSSIVEQTADTVVVTDCDGTIEYVNIAFEQLTGYSKDEAIGSTPRLLKSGFHDVGFYKQLWDVLLTGQIFHGEISNRKKNGEIFHEAKTITPLRNERGEITRFVATGKNITERKQAEEKLRKAYDDMEQRVQDRTEELRITNSELEDEINVRRQAEVALHNSERRLERAQEIAHLGSWEFDLLGNQLTWSDEVYRIFGLQPQEFDATYDAFLEAVHPDDRAAVNEAYFSSIRDSRDSYEIEHRVIKRASGETRIVHEKCEHFRDETGRIIRSVGMVHDITERKQVEEQLRYQAALLSNINDAVVAADTQFCLTAWNAAAEAMYGWEAKEVLGRNGLEIIRTEWQERDAEEMRRTISETGRWRGEATQERKDGSRFPVEVSTMVLRDAYGQITGYVSANRDITERKKAEELIARSNQKLNEILASIQDDFYVLDRDWNFVYVSRLFTLKVGMEPEDLVGKNIWKMFPKHEGTILEENFRAAMEKREVRRFEVGGKYTSAWYRMTAFPSAEGITILGTDITERKKAEEALQLAHTELEQRVHERTEALATANWELSNEISERKEVERQLRIQTAAMEAAANGIVITDPKGIILWTNPAVSQISGYSSQDLIGQSTRLFKSGRQTPEFYKEMWQSILTGNVWQGETTNRRKDGNLYIEEQTITPVHNEEGKLTHFIAIKQDITERKLIYSQLEDSNLELKTLTTLERQQRFLAQGLVESSMALNMSLDLHAVLDHIFEQTRRTIPYMAADIVLIDDGLASVVRQWGFDDRPEPQTIFEKDNLRLQDFPTWQRICESQAAVLIADTDLERQWDTYFGMRWIRSYLGAPLIYNDQVIGIINLISDQADAFHEEMAKNLRAFAAPAAVAIQNARLYETEQQNRKAAEILSAASVALAQTLDIQMVMETVLDYAQFILSTDMAFIILSEGDERYRIRAVRTSDDYSVLRESLLDRTIDVLSEPMVRSHIASYENMCIPDAREVTEWSPPLELGFLNCWLGIPLESMGKRLGVVVMAHAIPNSFKRYQIQLMEAVVKQAVVALQNAWLFDQVRSGRERLQQLSRHLVEIQENERKYIARELHDETSQSLTSLKIGLQVIEQKAAGHQLLLDQVAKLKSLADETLESLHRLAVNLRPASLDHLGLVDALNGLIETTRQRSGIMAHFKTMGSMQSSLLTEEIESSIYRIVQESLTNVIRHARASHVDIILEWQQEKIVIIIEDDGIGIDMQKARESGHLGLIGMQERAEMLGGRLLVDSTPQFGTTLVVEIPYVHSNTIS